VLSTSIHTAVVSLRATVYQRRLLANMKQYNTALRDHLLCTCMLSCGLLHCRVQDTFDPALLRSGRFGMQIQFDAPDREGREQLFTQYLKPMKLSTKEVSQSL
jgi:SpoVK/Ycf46/Vps4 family AAA+-type ATPase